MNKITTLLSLLLFFVASTASADNGHETLSATSLKWKTYVSKSDAITELSQITDGGTYILNNPNRDRIVMIKNSYDGFNNLRMGGDSNTKLSSLNANDDKWGLAVFTFHKVEGEDNTYTIESAWNGYYIDYVNSDCYLSTTPAKFIVSTTNKNNETKSGKFCIKNGNDDGKWFDMKPDDFTSWDGTGENCWFELIPATVSDAEVTYHNTSYSYNVNGTKTTAEKAWLKNGATFHDATTLKSYYLTFTLPENTTVSANNRDFVVTATGEAPITFDKGYTLHINVSGDRYLTATTDGGIYRVNTLAGNFEPSNLDEFLKKSWTFVASNLGTKLYNKGYNKYIKVQNDGNVTLDNEGTEFYMTKVGEQFGLHTSTNNQYLNASVEYNGANNRLGTWGEENPSNGSTIYATDISSDVAKMSLVKGFINNNLNITAPEDADNYLTFPVETFASAKTAVESATNFEELLNILGTINPEAVAPEVSTYYRIKNVGTAEGNAYITTDGMFVGKDGSLKTAHDSGIKVNEQSVNRNITRSASDAAFGPQIWKFIQRGNEFSLKNANTQCNFAFFDGTLDMPVKPDYYDGSIKLIPVADGNNTHFNMVWGDKVIGTNGDTNIKPNANARTEATNIWQIEKVTFVPVSITAAGMASICYPMPLQVSKNQATAYYVSSIANGEMQLEEYPNGIIPANQGAILVGNEGTVSLNVVENSDFTATNHLKGATARRAGFTAETLYMLGMSQQQNKPLFMKSKLTTVPANKAYVDATDVTAADANLASLSFNFGTVDAISDVIANDKKAETYYDLNGRVVLYPQHGIFVTSAGKKIFIK